MNWNDQGKLDNTNYSPKELQTCKEISFLDRGFARRGVTSVLLEVAGKLLFLLGTFEQSMEFPASASVIIGTRLQFFIHFLDKKMCLFEIIYFIFMLQFLVFVDYIV